MTLLIERGLLVGLPASLEAPPRSARHRPSSARRSATCTAIAGTVTTSRVRCRMSGSSCARLPDGSAERAIASTVDQPVRKPAPGQSADAALRIEPRHPDRSALMQRMASRYPRAADAAARHRAGRPPSRATCSGAGSPEANETPQIPTRPGERTMTMKRVTAMRCWPPPLLAPAAAPAPRTPRRARR